MGTCVNCMEWIGERIEMVERELQEEGGKSLEG